MHIHRSHKRMPEVSLVPLINVIFILLIFFMVTGSVAPLDIVKVNLPIAQNSLQQISDGTNIFIARDKTIAVNNDIVTADDLPTIIQTIIIENPKVSITLKVDNQADANYLISILDTLYSAGAENVVLQTNQKNQIN